MHAISGSARRGAAMFVLKDIPVEKKEIVDNEGYP